MNNNKDTIYREAIIAAFCAAAVALAYMLLTPPFWLAEEPAIAAHLAHGDGYLSPLTTSPHTIPTAMSPPLYPMLMAAVYRMLGIASSASLHVMLAINVLSAGLVCAGIYVLAARCFNIRAARWASLLFLLNPVFGRGVTVLWHTYPVLAALIWTIVWCRGMNEKKSASLPAMLLLGIDLGLMALASPTVALSYPILVIHAIGRTRWMKWLMLSAACFAMFCAVQAPWAIRNYRVFGRIMFVRDNLPLEIWTGNLPGSSGAQAFVDHPCGDPVERAKLLAQGENQYFDHCWKEFVASYKQDPLSYWQRTARRVGMLAVDPYLDKKFPLPRKGVDVLFALIGLAGLFTAWRLRLRFAAEFASLAMCSVTYIFTAVNPSYTMPLRVGLILSGGLALASLAEWFAKRQPEALGRAGSATQATRA